MLNNLSSKANSGFASVFTLHLLFVFMQLVKNDHSSSVNEINYNHSLHSESKSSTVFNLNEEDKQWIEYTLASMPLYEKCAQIFMPSVFGQSLINHQKNLIIP